MKPLTRAGAINALTPAMGGFQAILELGRLTAQINSGGANWIEVAGYRLTALQTMREKYMLERLDSN